jgi:dihydroorotase
MSEYEYWESHPEIRKDLDFVFECEDYFTWQSWEKLYKDLPNVKVVMKIEGANNEV